MKNTLENKAKFFAQYYNQEVLANTQGTPKPIVKLTKSWNWKHSGFYLELKPLSSISNEDLSNIDFGNIGDKKVTFYPNSPDRQWVSSCGNMGYLMLDHFDYLRSKGYALPYNGITVDEQLEYGWIKLKDQ